MIYANNGSGKTTLALLFRSLNGNNDIVNKKSFDSKVAPEIKLLEEGNIKINFSKGKWSKFISNIEIFDSFYIDDNFYIITLKDDLKTPNIFEILLGEESVKIKK